MIPSAPVHLLYLRLPTAERFGEIHGAEITVLARADLDRNLSAALRLLVGRHQALSEPRSPRFGLWAIAFEMRRQEIATDPDEQASVIVEAARETGRKTLVDQLGAATALHARLEAGIIEIPRSDLEPARLDRRLEALKDVPVLPPDASAGAAREALAAARLRLDIFLQPIVSLESGATVGFEGLARGPLGGPVREPIELFEAAWRLGVRTDVELECLGSALGAARRLPAPYWLAINLSPDLFGLPAVRRMVEAASSADRLVFEITEHLPIPSPRLMLEQTRWLREAGARLAFDDAGCGFLNMDMVRALKPDIVKLCITVTGRVARGREALDALRRTIASIRDEGAVVLAEGVENETQARLMRECGCALAQGFHFGRPRSAAEALAELVVRDSGTITA